MTDDPLRAKLLKARIDAWVAANHYDRRVVSGGAPERHVAWWYWRRWRYHWDVYEDYIDEGGAP